MTINDLVDDVVQAVPEAPMLTIRESLRWAQREICKQGNAWVTGIESALIAEDGESAEVAAPEGAKPVRLLSLESEGRSLEPGKDYAQVSASAIDLYVSLDAPVLSGRMAVMPAKDMPEALLAEHSEALCHGAKYRLLMLPQPWRDMELADFHRKHWRAGVNDAYRLAVYGRHVGGAKVKQRPFI